MILKVASPIVIIAIQRKIIFVWIFLRIDLRREHREEAHDTLGNSKVLVETVESWKSIARVACTLKEIYGSLARLYAICSAKLFYAFSVTVSGSFANGCPPLLIASHIVSRFIYTRIYTYGRLRIFRIIMENNWIIMR